MKFNDCNDAEMLRGFARFLMRRITEMYSGIDEAWEEYLSNLEIDTREDRMKQWEKAVKNNPEVLKKIDKFFGE